MKKLALLFVAAVMATAVSAQTVKESKTSDNFYIGINGGVTTKMTSPTGGWLNKLNPNAGLRIGRYFTPVFGMAVESNAYFSNKPYTSNKTVVRGINTSLLGTVNFSNWFGGYPGEPRCFEVIGLYGLGWGHTFDHNVLPKAIDALTSKAGIDLAFNLGAKKAWQFYVEPAVIWALNGAGYEGVEYNINRAAFQLNAGIVYKFRNSNGTHNFAFAPGRDQAEVDALNAQINALRDELSRKPKEVEIIKEVVKEVPTTTVREVKVEDLVFVTFAQGKSELTFDSKAALNNIKQGKHVQIVGTASPEGNPELNQRLSQARADVVAEYLKTRGVIVDEATGKGVQGTTSNRLAVVYVK
ncbi:MAG: OmpA family protein [Prevotella sp.]|nr:OmpA family protein [Prevotella sp.]